MTISEIYEVSRDEYIGFVEQIKPEARRVEVKQLDDNHVAANIYSTTTNKHLCARVACCNENLQEPERYYVIEMPEDFERKPPIPKRKIVLKTKEEVQALFNYLSKKQKEEKAKNEGNL